MPHKQLPILTSLDVTAEEREMINLLRAGKASAGELVTVPKIYINLLGSTLQAMKATVSKAQYAVDITEYLISQSVTPAIE